MQPNPLIVRAYALRGVRLWIGVRAFASVLIVLAGDHPLRLSPAAVLQLVLLSVAVCFIDTWRHHERALVGNLAVTPAALAGLFAAPAMAGEVVLFVVGILVA